MIINLSVQPKKTKYNKIIILSSIVVALLVLLVVIFQPNTTGVITREIRRLLSLEGNPQEEVKSIELTSNDYDGEGSWKVTKSAKWLAKDSAQIDIEVESVLKRRDAKYKDIIFVLDVSGSMTGSKIETVKSDATDLINYLMTPEEEGAEVGNTAALITFSDHSAIKQSFTNDKDVLTQKIQEITVGGNTNYNEPLQQVDEIMESYAKQSDHDTIVFFLTDGLPNVDTPNQIGTYRMLKEKYPYLIISGVQYEMGSTVVEEIKQISDEQYSTNMKTLRNAMYEITTRPIKYDKFYLEDIINDNYFNVESMSDITSTKGDYSLQPTSDNKQKVIWSMNNIYTTGEKETLTIKIKLKDEFVDNYGFYPTNNSTKVIYRLPDSVDTTVNTTDSPVLTNKFKVTYDTNTPEGCTLPSIPEEEYYIYSRVDQKTEELVCDGYVFDGYQTDSNDEKDITRINDNTFLMPAHDVTIRGTWSKVSITKSMEGTIHEKKTLYKVLEDEAKIGTYAKQYLGYHQDSIDEEVLYDGESDWETHYEFVSGLSESDITKIEDGSSYPFSYNEETHEWSSTNQDQHSTTSSITFKIDTSKLNGVPLHYKVSSESCCDRIRIYKDNNKVLEEKGEKEGDLDLSDITDDTEIKVEYYKDSSVSSGTDTATFSMANYKEVTNYIGNGKPKIYHWYAENNTNAEIIKDKNNVLFANHCWLMIRTTDTGGVKLLYNGESSDGKCLNTRDNHIGYTTSTQTTINSNYWYGTDYIYDKENKTFSLFGSISQVVWNNTTYKNIIGKYTCLSTSSSDVSCSKLYYVESYKDNSTAYTLELGSSSHYSQFGTLKYNKTNGSPSDVGYMSNAVYSYKYKEPTTTESVLVDYYHGGKFVGAYYSEQIEYVDGKYKMINPQKMETSDDVPKMIGKFYNSGNNINGDKHAYYVVNYSSGSSYATLLSLTNGNMVDDANTTYVYGDNYTNNGDGTYTINNSSNINRIEFYTNYSNVKNKYICKNATNNTCSDLWYVVTSYNTRFKYVKVTDAYKYSKTVDYRLDPEDNTYKYFLDEDTSLNTFNPINNTLNNAHYTCWNTNGKCKTLSYVFRWSDHYFYYIELTNGKKVEDAINEMFYNDNVNSFNSQIKSGVDEWYKKYILFNNYDNYIEDTIFCNNRTISDYAGWNPNGGDITKTLIFNNNINGELKCNNETDMFSVSNNKARLIYKVGLISGPESFLINRTISNYKEFWTISPYMFYASVGYDGSEMRTYYSSEHIYYTEGVRPVISLKPGMEYTEGDGSMEHPYYIDTGDINNG